MATVLGVTNPEACVGLHEPAARIATVCGAKAASLAVALGAGLSVMSGFVVTTAAHERYLSAGRRVPQQVAAAVAPPGRR
jgi:phosphoenolpyruvate synthase/pyruvate phosphate dikinase